MKKIFMAAIAWVARLLGLGSASEENPYYDPDVQTVYPITIDWSTPDAPDEVVLTFTSDPDEK